MSEMSIAVTTVPWREKPLSWVLAGVPNAYVCVDHEAKQTGRSNRDNSSRLWNNLRAWRAVSAGDGKWGLVLQDDVILCNDFIVKAESRLTEARRSGMRVVSFHSCLVGILFAHKRGKRWHRQPPKQFRNQQALAMQYDLARQFTRFAETRIPDHVYFDVLLAGFFSIAREPVYHTAPSLVDHDTSIPSTLGIPANIFGRERKSQCFKADGS